MKSAIRFHEFSHPSTVTCASLGKKSGQLIAAGTDDRKVVVWAVGKPSALTTLDGHSAPVRAVALDASEELVAAGGADGSLKIWDLIDARVSRDISVGTVSLESVDFHPFGVFCATGDSEGDLKIWDTRSSVCIQPYAKAHSGGIRVIKFSPDGRWIASGGADGVVKIWDLVAGKLLSELRHAGAKAVVSLEYHPSELLLAAAYDDGVTKLWSCESFECVATLPSASVSAVAFHPESIAVIVAGTDQALVVGCDPAAPPMVLDTQKTGWGQICDVAVTDGAVQRLVVIAADRARLSVFVSPLTKLPSGKDNKPSGELENQNPLTNNSSKPPVPRIRRTDTSGGSSTSAATTAAVEERSLKPLELVSFLSASGVPCSSSSGGGGKVTSDDAVLEEIIKPNPALCSLLSARLTKLKVVRAAWSKADVKATIDAVSRIKDHAVLVDVLRLLLLKKELFSLEVCEQLFPILAELLSSSFEEYVVSALMLFKGLVKSVGLQIKTTREVQSRGSVSDERLEQSNACFSVLAKVNDDVSWMKKRGGKLGNAARELHKMPEFNQFFKVK